jgi:hypothetical protein
MHDSLERIIEDYISEQAIEYQTSLDKIKEKFYTELHEELYARFQHFFANYFSTRELVISSNTDQY